MLYNLTMSTLLQLIQPYNVVMNHDSKTFHQLHSASFPSIVPNN